METVLVEIFARLLGVPDEKAGLILYSISNFYAWLTLIGDTMALDDRFKQFTSTWNKKAERLRPLNDIRVRLAHHTVYESIGANDWA